MNLHDQLRGALKSAMLARDEIWKTTIRLVLSAIKLGQIAKGDPLDDIEILAVLQKEVKSRQESIEDARKAKRPELEAALFTEIKILESFLPISFSPEELETFTRQLIQEMNASGMKDMGKVMKELTPRLEGRATGSQASQVVRTLLQTG